MGLMRIPEFERLSREAARPDDDTERLWRYEEFITHNAHDFLLVGRWYSSDMRVQLPDVAGALSVALAHSLEGHHSANSPATTLSS